MSSQWSTEQWLTLIGGSLLSLTTAIVSIINAIGSNRRAKAVEAISKKIDEHEERAEVRAKARCEEPFR